MMATTLMQFQTYPLPSGLSCKGEEHARDAAGTRSPDGKDRGSSENI